MSQRILLIDDDDDIRDVIQFGLEASGAWEVVSAASGASGIQLAIATQPAVILLDLMMPELDGAETLEQLHQHTATAQIPVIFLTARSTIDFPPLKYPQVKGILSKLMNPLSFAQHIQTLLA